MSEEINKRKEEVLQLLKKYFGNDPSILVPFMANIDHETGGSFDYKQIPYKRKDGTRENAYGLFMFNFHQPYYWEYVEKNNLVDSAESQIKYVHDAIFDGKSMPSEKLGRGHGLELQRLFKAGDYKANHDYLLKNFFKPKTPHADRRNKLLENYNQTITSIEPIKKSPKYEEVMPSKEIRQITREHYNRLPEGRLKDISIIIDDMPFSAREEINLERYEF